MEHELSAYAKWFHGCWQFRRVRLHHRLPYPMIPFVIFKSQSHVRWSRTVGSGRNIHLVGHSHDSLFSTTIPRLLQTLSSCRSTVPERNKTLNLTIKHNPITSTLFNAPSLHNDPFSNSPRTNLNVWTYYLFSTKRWIEEFRYLQIVGS